MEHNKTIGTLLKKYRNKKNIDIAEIAQKTKISINILNALEANDIKNLPNRTYVKGFVTTYAKTIGLDVEEAQIALENTYCPATPKPQSDEKSQELANNIKVTAPEKNESTTSNDETANIIQENLIIFTRSLFNKKLLYSIIGIIVFMAITKSVVNFFSDLNYETIKNASISPNSQTKEEPKTDIGLKPASSNLFDITATKKLAVQIIAEQSTKKEKKKEKEIIKVAVKETVKEESKPIVKIAEKVAPKRKDGKFPFKKFYPAPLDMYELVKDSAESKNLNLLPPSIKSSMKKDLQNVYIVATDQDTWISYKVDDKKIKRYVLKKGRRVLIRGEKILLFMGNFNAAKVFLNNQLVSADSKNSVKSMIFPESLASQYKLPLFPSFKGIPYPAEVYQANMASDEESISQ